MNTRLSFSIVLFFLVPILSGLSLAKQTEFFENKKTWIQETYFPSEVEEGDFSHILRTKTQVVGDTILCGKHANILKTTPIDSCGVEYENELYSYYNFAYEDNGVVYFYASGYKKFFELLNLNVQIGDSLYTDHRSHPLGSKNFSLEVVEDSTINMCGSVRRILKLKGDHRVINRMTYWIEGVGSTNDTYIAFFPVTTNGEKTNLIKCYKDDEIYFSREELGKVLPEAALPHNYFSFGKEAYLVYPIGLQDLDSYSYRFLTDPMDSNAEVREVAFCGYPHFVNCPDRNWGINFSVPDKIVFQGREYSVTRIDKIASDKIRNLTIPSTVRRLSDFSISSSELETLSLPASLQSIGYTICLDSKKLKTIEIAAVVPPVLSKDLEEPDQEKEYAPGWTPNYQLPFAEINDDCTLIVPEGSAELYRQDPVFGRFVKILEKKFGQSGVGYAETDGFTVKAVSGGLELNCGQSAKIRIYSVDGTVVKTISLNPGMTTIELPHGLYIVKTPSGTLKQIVR